MVKPERPAAPEIRMPQRKVRQFTNHNTQHATLDAHSELRIPNSALEKVPGKHPRDEFLRGTTLLPAKRGRSSGSYKPYAGNGAAGLHYSPALSQSQLGKETAPPPRDRLAPPADSLTQEWEALIPSSSFVQPLKHNYNDLSILEFLMFLNI